MRNTGSFHLAQSNDQPSAEDALPEAGCDGVCAKAWSSWQGACGFAALLALAVFYVSISWRKWPDPLVDFGRELYIPWRIAKDGAVLYLDVHDIYGPLSHYANAALFALFGPGLMVLVAANLAVFAAILATLYGLCCRAWGVGAAVAAGSVFIAVFGFSQFVGVGNYNFAAPYSHETTHGFLVCLLLVAALARWTEVPSPGLSALCGFFFGLTCVLKPEIMLAAGSVTFAAALVCAKRRRPPGAAAWGAWACGAVLPTLCFTVWFAIDMPWSAALCAASRAWINVLSQRTTYKTQIAFLGLDRPLQNLLHEASAALYALALIAVIGGAAWFCDRSAVRAWLRAIIGVALATALAAAAARLVAWQQTGQCLPGVALVYLAICAFSLIRAPAQAISGPQTVRLLLSALALALLARMILNARLYQFGYYQASIAAILVPAVMVGELPSRLKLGRWGRCVTAALGLALFAPGLVILTNASQKLLRLKTNSIGDGLDRFYIFPPELSATDELVRTVVKRLSLQPHEQTVLALPECVMINYLSRHPGSAANIADGEDALAEKVLRQRPPDWVVVISRDLREFGIERYGQDVEGGKLIMDWLSEGRYEPAGKLGGDPLDPRQRGVIVFKRKS